MKKDQVIAKKDKKLKQLKAALKRKILFQKFGDQVEVDGVGVADCSRVCSTSNDSNPMKFRYLVMLTCTTSRLNKVVHNFVHENIRS
jgi:hypothetical protein